MGFDANVEILRMAFWQIILAAGPVLAIALLANFMFMHLSNYFAFIFDRISSLG